MRLFLQIPPHTIDLYEEIEFIDEAAEVYKQPLWENRMAQPSRFENRSITPEQEFWGHCSNIQAWWEHEYDTRLLHSNLSFPLLKALSDAGDPKAKAIFEEEIAMRKIFEEEIAIRKIIYCGNCGIKLPDPSKKICPNCGITSRYLNMINSLKREFDIIAGAVIKGRQITYTTDNWDISGDVDSLLSSWFGQNAQFIMVSGVKYSILQMEAERLVAISLKGEGSICAKKDDDSISILQVKKYVG